MRRVEGAKLCLRTLASATSDKFSFIFGQYLLAGKKCFPPTSFIFGLLPLRHLSDAYHAMKSLYTNISLTIFSANPVIKRKAEFLISLTKTKCLGKLKAQEVIIFLENNLKKIQILSYPRPNV